MEFRIVATLRVQQLLMLDDALAGRSGNPSILNGRVHYRRNSLCWARTGIVLEKDQGVLIYCRTQGALLRSRIFAVPPLVPGSRPCGWGEGWEELQPALLEYEGQFGAQRVELVDSLPVSPLWRAAWWVELGSRVAGRVDHLLDRVLRARRA